MYPLATLTKCLALVKNSTDSAKEKDQTSNFSTNFTSLPSFLNEIPNCSLVQLYLD